MSLKDMSFKEDTKGQNIERRRFYDFDALYPLSHFEVDLKEIYDKGTLSEESITRASKLNIPPYQWTFIDVKTILL